MQVLVADDDPVYRNLLQELLEQWHLNVVVAADGSAAWEIMQQEHPPSLVILDWMMPGLDGFEVCSKIRNESAEKNIYVLIVTGSSKKEEVLRVVVAGADDYLIKPFDPSELKIRLRNAMRVLRLQDELDELRRSRQGQTTGAR